MVEAEKQVNSGSMSIFEPCKFYRDKRMHPIVPLIIFRAMNLSSQASVYVNFWVLLISETEDSNGQKVHADWSEDKKIATAVSTYVALGLGMVFGPWPMGILQDKYGHKASVLYMLTGTLISCTLLII